MTNSIALSSRLTRAIDAYESWKARKTESNVLAATIGLYEKADRLIDACNEEQSKLSKYVADIVTQLLRAVFGPQYEFKFENHISKGCVVGQRPVIYENGKELRQGGGVRNVAAFGNRLCFLLLKPGLSSVLVMDEYMNNLSSENYGKVISFVESLQKTSMFQLVFISQSSFDSSGRIIAVVKRKGVSTAI